MTIILEIVSKTVCLFILSTALVVCHAQTDSACVQKDVPQLLRDALNKAPKAESKGSGSLILVPIIGSNPATGFMYGLGGQYAFKTPGDRTLYSLLSGSAQVTTKQQYLFLLKNNIYMKKKGKF